jgi:hypothetical protein
MPLIFQDLNTTTEEAVPVVVVELAVGLTATEAIIEKSPAS